MGKMMSTASASASSRRRFVALSRTPLTPGKGYQQQQMSIRRIITSPDQKDSFKSDTAKANDVLGGMMPPQEERKIDARVQKMCAGELWKDRKFTVTGQYVLFGKVGSKRILDCVPLHQIDNVTLGCDLQMTIFTIKNGYNRGRSYVLQIGSESEGSSYLKTLQRLSQAAIAVKQRKQSSFLKVKEFVRKLYTNWVVQAFFAVLIFLNFLTQAVESQIMPEEGSQEAKLLQDMEIIMTFLFAFELLVNLLANWFIVFWCVSTPGSAETHQYFDVERREHTCMRRVCLCL